MSVSQKTKNLIWGTCAARCCICKEPLIRDGNEKSHIGEIAHIVGRKVNAPRGNSNLSIQERNNVNNLMLLCPTHHSIIDKYPEEYPIEKLHNIKRDHINWVKQSLVYIKNYKCNIKQYSYINIFRLREQASIQNLDVNLDEYKEFKSLHSLGYGLFILMNQFESLLKNLNFKAIPIDKLEVINDDLIGSTISFEKIKFRTKNIYFSPDKPTVFTGNLDEDPHIYTKIENFKCVLNIDSKYITTSTAFCLFRPKGGQSEFSGLGVITNIDYINQVIIMTPWVLGIPESNIDLKQLSDEILEKDDYSSHYNQNSNLDKYTDIKTAKKRKVFYNSAPKCCDLCSKLFENEKYLIDCQMKQKSSWAYMCEDCFSFNGKGIDWGMGQLYMNTKEGWLLVGGFSPEEDY